MTLAHSRIPIPFVVATPCEITYDPKRVNLWQSAEGSTQRAPGNGAKFVLTTSDDGCASVQYPRLDKAKPAGATRVIAELRVCSALPSGLSWERLPAQRPKKGLSAMMRRLFLPLVITSSVLLAAFPSDAASPQ